MPNSQTKTDKDRLRDAEEIIRQKQARLVLLEKDLRLIQRSNDSAEKVRKEIYDLKEVSPEPPKWLIKARDPKSSGVPVAILSDVHKGERVFADQVGGVNEFNRVISRARLKTWLSALLDLTKHHMVKPDYPGLILMLLGDMITGCIHDDLRETNDGPVQLSVLELQEELIAIISILADQFGNVFIPCTVGNHGRETPKPRTKFVIYTSYEWNLYCQLEYHFRNDPRVQFFIPNEIDAYFVVQGHRCLATHGDRLGVKGGDGIIGILGPVTRGTIKLGQQTKQVGRDFDTLFIGHGHTYIPRSEAAHVVMNGCVIGYNEYAHAQLRVPYSRPTQYLGFIHPKYGITCQWPMYLDQQPKPKAADWVTWQDRRAPEQRFKLRNLQWQA